MYEMKNLFSPSEQGESADGAHHCCHGLQSCRDVSCPVAVEPAEADEDGPMVPSSFTHCVGGVKDNVVGRVSQGSRWLLPGDSMACSPQGELVRPSRAH